MAGPWSLSFGLCIELPFQAFSGEGLADTRQPVDPGLGPAEPHWYPAPSASLEVLSGLPRYSPRPLVSPWLTLLCPGLPGGLGESALRGEWRAEGAPTQLPCYPFLPWMDSPGGRGPCPAARAFLPSMSDVGGEVMAVPSGARTCGIGIVGNPLIRG